MGANQKLSRRALLRATATASAAGVGLAVGGSNSTTAQSSEYGKQVHDDLQNTLSQYAEVWEVNGENQLQDWSKTLAQEATGAVNPVPTSLTDLLPKGGDKIATLVDQMIVTTGFMEQTRWTQARTEYRVEWERQDGYNHSLQKGYYKDMGYGVENSLVSGSPQQPGHPYLALYMSLIRGLPAAYYGDIAYETLEIRGNAVSNILNQRLLPQLPEDNKYETALHANLETLDQLATATVTLATERQ